MGGQRIVIASCVRTAVVSAFCRRYEALKAALSERLLAPMYRLFPQLKGAVVFHELGSPLSSQFYLNAAHGESYGLAHTPARFRQRWLRPQSPIQGLYLTGQDTLSCGVMGAATAGFLTAIAVDVRVAWQHLRILTKL